MRKLRFLIGFGLAFALIAALGALLMLGFWPNGMAGNSPGVSGSSSSNIMVAVKEEGSTKPSAKKPSANSIQQAQNAEGADQNRGDSSLSKKRREMVEQQIAARGIEDASVLRAMRNVPRHEFVPEELRAQAYSDSPLPIGHDQTISQPYIVALMTQLAEPKENSKALDIGTGSGYQAAVLAELVDQVYTIEIVETLGRQARSRLEKLGYKNIECRVGDGYQGWPEQAPFDVILVAAAPDHVPGPLIEQLAPGGHLVIPVGRLWQDLLVIDKAADGSIRERRVTPVRFVPMTGQAENAR